MQQKQKFEVGEFEEKNQEEILLGKNLEESFWAVVRIRNENSNDGAAV